MSRFVAFLRGINVGGARTVKMDSLRQIFESLGYSRVATFIASGNVMFETIAKDGEKLEREIEKKLREALGYEVGVFVRTEPEMAEIASYNPFARSEIDAGAELQVVFLSDALEGKLEQEVARLSTDTDEFRVHGREIYWLRRKKQGQSVYSTVPLERTLRRPFTVRSAGTAKKMAAKYCSARS